MRIFERKIKLGGDEVSIERIQRRYDQIPQAAPREDTEEMFTPKPVAKPRNPSMVVRAVSIEAGTAQLEVRYGPGPKGEEWGGWKTVTGLLSIPPSARRFEGRILKAGRTG